VILGEGVNNLLTQKLDLIGHDIEPARAALAFKQVIGLDQDAINNRFGLPDKNHGVAVSVLGDVSLGLPGMGFVYTNQKSISVGLGMMLDVAAEYRLRPYEVLERYLQHPAIAPLVEGGQLLEYGAHLIPEGGYRDMPQLYTGGVMVTGDAAAMVNALHWEGTNMAIISGKAAAETAIEAHQRGDFSSQSLSEYRARLESDFILPDLKQYRNFSHFLETHPEFMGTYPAFLNEALGRFFSAYGKPKRRLFNEIFGALTERRSLVKAAGDFIAMGRAVMGW
jgi:electron transfer flavoprotein-quinone oxidoreductase